MDNSDLLNAVIPIFDSLRRLQLSGQTITAVGVADELARFDELMSKLESFLATSLAVEG